MGRNGFDVGIFESRSDYHRQRNARQYFYGVARAYIDIRNTPPLTAINYDPLIKNPKLGADLIHFIADVELATRKALGKNPELFDQWKRLVSGENVPNAASIINRCARLYQARQLVPELYFRVIKKGRSDRRPSATAMQQGAA